MKKVSNLMLAICSFLDILEEPILDFNKFSSIAVKIDSMFYEVDRHIRKRIKDEFHLLDFKSHDLLSLAEAAEKHLMKLQPKCTFKSMKKTLSSKGELKSGDFTKFQNDICTLFYIVTALRRIASVFSYQALLVEILEGEEESCKIENVFLEAIREELKHSSVSLT